MINNFDLPGIVQQFVEKQLRFYKHYIGKVVNNIDPIKKGRVQVTIDSLGLSTQDIAIFCSPRQGSAMIIPQVGSSVEVYFIEADPNRPVYLHPATEILDQCPSGFSGIPTDNLLYQDMVNKTKISHDLNTQIYSVFEKIVVDVLNGTITMLNGTEPFVLGNTIKTELQKIVDALQQLVTDFTTWVPVPTDGGGALKTLVMSGFTTKAPANLTNVLSSKIKGL